MQAPIDNESDVKNIRSLCMRCYLQSILAKNNFDWQSPITIEELANQWGKAHTDMLLRYLNGEVEWIPRHHFGFVVESLRISPKQEKILRKMNHRSFFNYHKAKYKCSMCKIK